MPPKLRLRDGAAQQSIRLPAAAAGAHAADALPAAEEGLRRVQARHGRHAQAVSRQCACIYDEHRNGGQSEGAS